MSFRNKIFFVDCDNTIRYQESLEFVEDPERMIIFPGVPEALDIALKNYDLCVGVCNGLRIGNGISDFEDNVAIQKVTLERLPQLSSIYFCGDIQGNTGYQVLSSGAVRYCHIIYSHLIKTFRKPNIGLFACAMMDYQTQPNQCFYVGDRPTDQTVAAKLGIDFLPADVWRASGVRKIIDDGV